MAKGNETVTPQPAPEVRVDFSRWAVVAHKDDTGFGRMAEDLKSMLQVGYHLVIPSERLQDRPLIPPRELWLRPKDPEEIVRQRLQGLQGIIFFERYDWHPQLMRIAREMGVKSVCIPMWEWFRGWNPIWELCDLFICPNRFALQIVRRYGWQNSLYLPWVFDLRPFPHRQIRGPARLFIHNAGLVDPSDRKGTRDTIRAFTQVRRRDLNLIVRLQKEVPLPPLDDRIQLQIGNLEDPADLYREGDVAIQPSKMEGLGFMVLEPLGCGLPVITLDYPPMSEYVQQPELRVKKQWFKRKAFPTGWVKHAHLRLPRIQDLTRKIEWCAAQDMEPISRANRQWAEHRFDRIQAQHTWSQVLGALLQGQIQAPERS